MIKTIPDISIPESLFPFLNIMATSPLLMKIPSLLLFIFHLFLMGLWQYVLF